MATILQFPSARIQGLSFLEDQLRDLLRGKGADEELMDYAASTVRDIYQRNVAEENYSFSLSLPEDTSEHSAENLQRQIESGVAGIRAENHSIIIRLIAELALAEVKLFQLQRAAETS